MGQLIPLLLLILILILGGVIENEQEQEAALHLALDLAALRAMEFHDCREKWCPKDIPREFA